MKITYIPVENFIAEWADKKKYIKKMGWIESLYFKPLVRRNA